MDVLGLEIKLPAWLNFAAHPLGMFLVNLFGWVIIALLVYYLTYLLIKYATRHTRTRIDDLIIGLIRKPLLTLLVAYGILRSWELAWGESKFSLALHRIYNGLLIISGAYVAWRILFEIIVAYLKPKVQESDSQADDIIIPILSRIGPVIIVIAAANAVVAALGGNLGTLLAGLGLLGLVLGYLFQEPLQGLFSGTYMALDNPFRQDDLLILEDGTTCQVRSIGVRVTQLYDVKRHILLFMPNARLAASRIVNLTKPSVELRVVLNVSISKPCDLKTATALLTEACNSHENVLGEWPKKQAAMRRRLEFYRGEYQRLLSLGTLSFAEEVQKAWLEEHLTRLEGELVRLEVEHDLRARSEEFSKELIALIKYCSYAEDSGFSANERQEIKRRILEAMDHFDDLIERITVWLYLVKIIECELIDTDYSVSIASFIQRDLLRDGKLTLQELAQCNAPGAPTEPMVKRSDLNKILSSDIEADKAVDRAQFRDRAHYVDYKRLYSIWHRNITHVYRGLEKAYHVERLRGEQEQRLDERIHAIERHFSDTFLLRVSYWQLPSANLVDANDGALTFQLAFFIDDVVREQFQRAERVTTEVLAEVDRLRSLFYASRSVVNPN
jgi:small-conductance mechanosensitive channel